MDQRTRSRVSRSVNAVTVRARTNDNHWCLVRLARLNPGLTVRVTELRAIPVNSNLHG